MTPSNPPATIAPDRARDGRWDVVVVGAGPAGGLAAHEAARLGARVLLVEKATFPRGKVCGCCLNAAGRRCLEDCGLGRLLAREPAVPLDRVCLAVPGVCVELPIAGPTAIDRAVLDAALVRAACAAGADFLPATRARVGRFDGRRRHVHLDGGFGRGSVSAPVVVVADGLAGGALDDVPGFAARAIRSARIGLSTQIDPGGAVEPGVVALACGRGGYVGTVALADGRLDVAAAIDPGFVRASGGAAPAVRATLEAASRPIPDGLDAARWRGTPGLTRRRRLTAAPGLIVAGDAAGYVEPFTGEGMAWALIAGRDAGRFAVAAPDPTTLARRWHREHERRHRRRQRRCRVVAGLLRSPRLTRWCLRGVAAFPFVIAPLVAGGASGRLRRGVA